MIYTAKTKLALKLCFDAHKDQTDKSNMPYVFHPFHLAEKMDNEKTTIVALLHDVIEDTEYTVDDLRNMGFDDDVLTAITLMTHQPDIPYMEYIASIKKNEIARTVKLADLHHNSDLTRLETITEKDQRRAEKYFEAIKLLEEEG